MTTIKSLIVLLTNVDQNLPIVFSDTKKPKSFGSYRGYYSDLAVGSSSDNMYWSDDGYDEYFFGCDNILNDTPRVSDFLSVLTKCTGYRGYKGGYFHMNTSAPLWYSEFGINSQQIISDIRVETNQIVLMIKDYSK